MDLITWLKEGDVAILYQTYRDILNQEKPELRNRIASEGFGKRLLTLQQKDGHWGGGYYRKKWISTHYTLMELRRLNAPPTEAILKACNLIIDQYTVDVEVEGSFRKIWTIHDVCMCAMMFYAFTYWQLPENKIRPMLDYMLDEQMKDGGYNCDYKRPHKHPHHSSLHSTISVIEAMNGYIMGGYHYRKEEVLKQRKEAIEFVLMHRLFKSDKTGEPIKKQFTLLSFPPRWKYDILRSLDALRESGMEYDPRMEDAFEVLYQKRRKDGTWPVQQKYSGAVHFDMEPTGSSSRMNTLRVLRVLKHFKPQVYQEILNETKKA
ncbi:MAG: hypothetical protein JXB08_06735 [Bacilli bacterium]|nr:hypothetical protein [Bacilli bacterium]MBN2877767.1 hypothetical protein [Bacilli bacterium]